MKRNSTKLILLIIMVVCIGASFMIKPFVPKIQQAEAAQIHNPRFQELDVPTEEQYKYKDWKQTTMDYLEYVFNTSNTYDGHNGDFGGLYPEDRERAIGRFVDAPNIDEYFGDPEGTNKAWGLPSYVGDIMNDKELGEGIAVLSALASAAVVGVPNLNNYELKDGTTFNFVKSAVAYYSPREHIVLNSDTASSGGSFWYQLLPQVCFSVLAAEYADEEPYLNDIVTESARNSLQAVIGMGGPNADFGYMGYSLILDEPIVGNWREPDAAAGFAYTLYSAYALNKNLLDSGKEAYATESEIEQFRLGTIWCMDYLDELDYSPFYEVLAFLAPYLAARLNVEQGTNYDVAKMIGWTMNGESAVRSGWGVITENWGGRYTEGLVGSLTDCGGYAFALNTFDAALGFVPMLRYDNRYAEDIAKWMLCVSQSAQMFYPESSSFEGSIRNTPAGDVYNGDFQSGKWIDADDSNIGGSAVSSGNFRASFIPYEGLRRYRNYITYNSSNPQSRTKGQDGNSPYASGDGYTQNWNRHTDYGLYGAGHVGFFGAVIGQTNVKRILEIDLNKLDIYNTSGDVSFRMYFNPYDEDKQVEITVKTGSRLWDTLTKSYVGAPESDGKVIVTIPAGATMICAEIANGMEVTEEGGKFYCGDVFLTQDRGSASVSLYASETGGNTLKSGETVSGNIFAEVSSVVPEGSNVQSVELLFGKVSVYKGDSVDGRISIDTKTLRNGSGTFTAIVTFTNGSTETSSASVRILNSEKVSVFDEYLTTQDFADAWATATDEWQQLHPESDHDTQITATEEGIRITNMSARSFAWASSPLFYVDFSRAPMLELSIDNLYSSQYAVKLYVEGDKNSVADKFTGRYVVIDSGNLDKLSLDLSEVAREIGLDVDGVEKISIKISTATSNTGSFVEISDFALYHSYLTPAPIEPDEYEWGFEFTSPYMSIWQIAEGNPTVLYTQDGDVSINSEASNAAIVGPYAATSVSLTPIMTVQPLEVDGSYYAGVMIEGHDQVYVLAENQQTADAMELNVVGLLKTIYGINLSPNERIAVVVGAEEGSTVLFDKVTTMYKLPDWGTMVDSQLFTQWEKQPAQSSRLSISVDSGNRTIFKNTAYASNEIAVGGRRGVFNVNFDFNPQLEIIVRDCMGEWRLTATVNDKYVTLIDWNRNASRDPIAVDLKQVFGNVYGKQTLYLNIEVKGGTNYVTLQSIATSYEKALAQFGKPLDLNQIVTLNANDGSEISVKEGLLNVACSEGQIGLLANDMLVAANRNAYVKIDGLALGVGSQLLVTLKVGDKTVVCPTIAKGGDHLLDVRQLLGFDKVRQFNVDVTITPISNDVAIKTGSCTMQNVAFVYGLESIAQGSCEDGYLVWSAVDFAREYKYVIYDSEGNALRKGSAGINKLNVENLALETGIYYADVYALADGCTPSATKRIAFKMGDIESVVLDTPTITIDGVLANWTECVGTSEYKYTLLDADSGDVLSQGFTTNLYVDLSQLNLSAFNYKLIVQALGDGAAYLDGAETVYEFYTNTIDRYLPQQFAAMNTGDNNAFAELSADGTEAIIKTPIEGWGNVVSPTISLDFDQNPVIRMAFGTGNVGGYHLDIRIDGIEYVLCDDTYVFPEGDLILDVNKILAEREDGPDAPITGVRNVVIVFGIANQMTADLPVVHVKSAYVYQITKGRGVAKLGQLDAPVVSVDEQNKVISWQEVKNATSYTVEIFNELGLLISRDVTENNFSYGVLAVKGNYSVNVTAKSDTYYASEVVSKDFVISGDVQPQQPSDSGETSYVWLIAVGGVVLAGAVVLTMLLGKRK